MPRIDHPDLGDIINSQYRTATIVSVDAALDTAEIDSSLGNFLAVPIFYHCTPGATTRSNGALEGGSAAFAASDEVVVLFQPDSNGNPVAKYIMGFVDGIKACEKLYLYIYDQIGVNIKYWDIDTDLDVTGEVTTGGWGHTNLTSKGGASAPLPGWLYLNGNYDSPNDEDTILLGSGAGWQQYQTTITATAIWDGTDEGIIFCSEGDQQVALYTKVPGGSLVMVWTHYDSGDYTELDSCSGTMTATAVQTWQAFRDYILCYIASSDGDVNGMALGIGNHYTAVNTYTYTGGGSDDPPTCDMTSLLETTKIIRTFEQDIVADVAGSMDVRHELGTKEESTDPVWGDHKALHRGGVRTNHGTNPAHPKWVFTCFTYKDPADPSAFAIDKWVVSKYSYVVDESGVMTLTYVSRMPNLEAELESLSTYRSQAQNPVYGLIKGV